MLASSSECQLPRMTFLAVPAFRLSEVPVISYSACSRCPTISIGTFLSAMALLNGVSNPPIGAINTFEPAGIFVWVCGGVWAGGCCERADSLYPVVNNKSTPNNFQCFISVLHRLSARFSPVVSGELFHYHLLLQVLRARLSRALLSPVGIPFAHGVPVNHFTAF